MDTQGLTAPRMILLKFSALIHQTSVRMEALAMSCMVQTLTVPVPVASLETTVRKMIPVSSSVLTVPVNMEELVRRPLEMISTAPVQKVLAGHDVGLTLPSVRVTLAAMVELAMRELGFKLVVLVPMASMVCSARWTMIHTASRGP
jgi:hypothetical protein